MNARFRWFLLFGVFLFTASPRLQADIIQLTNGKAIKTTILEEVLIALPELIEKLGDSFINNLPINDLVQNNINKFDLLRLEKMIVEASNKEFKFIEYLGGIVGVIIGIMQVAIMQFLK